MSFIQQFFTSRDNNANAETFVGQEGRLWWDPVTNQIYSSDGSTPGGIPLAGGGGNGSPGGSNSQVQFNQNGTFGGSANLTFNRVNGALSAVSFVGDGGTLSNIAGANVVGEVTNATYASSAVTAITAETVTANSQPNINSLGILTELSVTGNVTGDYFIGNGSQLTGISTGASNTIFNGNSNVAIATPNGNITITANISQPYTWTFDTSGELLLAGDIVSSSNLIIKTNNDDSWISQAVGANGFSQLYWTSNISAANPYNGNDDYAWAYVDSGGFFVTSHTVEPDRTYDWSFRGSDGALISPGKFITPPGDTGAIFDFRAQGDGGSSNLEFGADAPGSQYFYASAQDPVGRSAEFVLNAVDEGNLNAQIRTSDGLGTTMQWDFTANGDLILPGDTAYIGSDASRVSIYSDINTESAGITVVSGSSTNIFNEGVVNIETNSVDVMHQWQFDQTGNLTIPGSIILPDLGSIMTTGYNNPGVLMANADSNWAYGFSSDNVANYYTQVKFFGDNSTTRGFKILDSDSGNTWLFDGQGIVTLPGEGIIRSINDTVALQSLNTTTGNANSVYLGSSGGLGFSDQAIGGNWLEIFRNGAEPEIRVPVGRGNLNLQTAEGENSYNWSFGNDGTTTFPGNIIDAGSNPITLWSTDSSTVLWRSPTGGGPGQPFQSTLNANNGNATIELITGIAGVGSISTWTFNTGNVVFPDATVQTTAYPGTATAFSVIGNITGGNVTGTTSVTVGGTGGDLTMTGGAITGAGNITSNGIMAINAPGGITTTAGSFDIVNATATTVNIGGSATAVNIGATTGTLTLNNPVVVGTQATQNVFHTTATAINAFGAATAITMGATSGTLTLRNPTIVGTQTTQSLFNTVATTVNFAGAATTLNIGGAGNATFSANTQVRVSNTSGSALSVAGNITGGNLITTGAVYSNYNTNTANTGSFMAQGGNTKGGTGYLDFLVVQNTSGGATVPYKWLRTTSDGQFQIINSAYTQNIFNLTDAGNVAIPGQLFINGAQTTNGPAFSAYAAAILQTIPNDTQTKVLFQTEEYNTNNCYANSRFTPNVAGYYQLNAEVRLDGASGTGEMMIILYKNGAEYKRGTNQRGTQIAANFWAMQVSSVAYANGTGDYFEIYVQQGSGGSVTVTAVNNTAITWFNGCMLRGA